MFPFAVDAKQNLLNLQLQLLCRPARLDVHPTPLPAVPVVLGQDDPHTLPGLLSQGAPPLGCHTVQHMLHCRLEVCVCHQRLGLPIHQT